MKKNLYKSLKIVKNFSKYVSSYATKVQKT